MRFFKLTIALSALIVVSFFAIIINKQQTMSTISHYNHRPDIIIDPGHGGFDGGAEGYDNTVEKHINLDISLKLRDMLKSCGYNVIMTREEDISTCDDGLGNLRDKKRSDIYNRMDIIKANPNAIFVSIHQNKFEQSRYKGAQVFYSTNNPNSKIMAQIIQQQIIDTLQPENKREVKPAENNLYLLYNSKVPSVLVECGFISNPEECIMLKDEEYQAKLSFTICSAIIEYDMSQKIF